MFTNVPSGIVSLHQIVATIMYGNLQLIIDIVSNLYVTLQQPLSGITDQGSRIKDQGRNSKSFEKLEKAEKLERCVPTLSPLRMK